jgi:hypothetical protein
MTSEPLLQPFSLPRRTRKNVVQSKNGCVTCKSRRKKCDETLPSCRNCQTTGKRCDGYSSQAIQRLNVNQQGETEEHRLLKICFDVLQYGQYGTPPNASMWLQLLVPISYTSSVVRASVVLFGAVCDSMTASPSYQIKNASLRRRMLALSSIRHGLASESQDPVSLFLACSILAAGEALLGDLASAIMHAQAAFKLVGLCGPRPTCRRTCSSATSTASSGLVEHLYTLAMSMDIHSASYRLSQPPDLPARYSICDNYDSKTGSANPDLSTLFVIHSCYHFTARAHPFKYDLVAARDPLLLAEQSQLLAALRSRIGQIDKLVLGVLPPQRLMLRAQCLSALIYVSAILNPFETFYDKHEGDFFQIVHTCHELLGRPSFNGTQGLTLYRFDPGILQPCYLTAMKCRNPTLRRQAQSILSKLGHEGPWNGQLLAATVSQAIELEEVFGCPIQEQHRIHGCATFTPEFGDAPGKNHVESEFSLCSDVQAMLRANDADNPLWWTFIKQEIPVDGKNFS